MAGTNQLDRVWQIIERQGVCMLTTGFDGGLRARPLQPRPDRGERLIWFVTARSTRSRLNTMSA